MPCERAVLCDFDGTLADTRDANRSAYAVAFASAGIEFPAEAYDAHFGLNFTDMMAAIAPRVPSRSAALIAAEKSKVYPEYFHLVRPNDALVTVLRCLQQGGHRLALVSTARRANVVALSAALGLRELFEVVVTAEDVDRGKPAPDAYLLAARLLGHDPRDCVVFEDSDHGVGAAEAAGCRVMRVVL